MLLDLSEIRVRRRQAGVSQIQLANAAGVSQSLVAKIERGSANPSFDSVRRLFLALEAVQPPVPFDAAGVCQRRVFSVSPFDPLSKAIRILETHSISQLMASASAVSPKNN